MPQTGRFPATARMALGRVHADSGTGTSTRGRGRWLAVVGVVAVALAGATGCRSTPAHPLDVATVVRVVDGDTVVLRLGGGEETVRLLGIDTPETVKPGEPVECFGPEASDRLEELLPRGSRVRVERDIEMRDRYGRLLLFVFRTSDDVTVNQLMLEGGYARPLTIAPNRARVAELRAAADLARSEGRGLWSRCPTENP